MYSLYQGDQYYINFVIATGSPPVPIELTNIDLIEFAIGNVIKQYPEEVTYNSDTQTFNFPITQQESMQLLGYEPYQVRIKYKNSEVYGSNVNKLNVKESLSNNIL